MRLIWQTLFWKNGWFLSNFQMLQGANFQLTQPLPATPLAGSPLHRLSGHHPRHPGSQTSRRDAVVPAFSPLYPLGSYWNSGRRNASQATNSTNTSEVTENRDWLFLHPCRNATPDRHEQQPFCTGSRTRGLSFLLGLCNLPPSFSQLYVFGKDQNWPMDVLC